MMSNLTEAKKPKLDLDDICSEADDSKAAAKQSDSFVAHFCTDHNAEWLEKRASSRGSAEEYTPLLLPSLGASLVRRIDENSLKINCVEHVKKTLTKNLQLANISLRNSDAPARQVPLTQFQMDLFSVMSNYHDIFYARRTLLQGDEIHLLIALHSLNHVLKARSRILQHAKSQQPSRTPTSSGAVAEYRDFGLTRPKILILLPFRHSAYLIVKAMIRLLFGNNRDAFVSNKKRFFKDYGPGSTKKTDQSEGKSRRQLPIDFKLLFQGNRDDCFRFGLSVGKNSLKLYTDFYASDVIVASPVGLRSAMGTKTERHWDCDFLSSIEVVILDQADVFLMQNWKHVIHVVENMHQLPRRDHDVDYSKVRMWCINGLAKYYCQMLLFSSITTPELQALFLKHAYGYSGQMIMESIPSSANGCLGRIVVRVSQWFNRVDAKCTTDESESRYQFFTESTLPNFCDATRTIIFVPSYFDFVRLRNYMKRQNCSFVHASEYSNPKKVSRARSLLFHGDVSMLLMTERLYFYHRYVIRGANNLVFYQLPSYGNFYAELCNMLTNKVNESDTRPITCTVLYTQFDRLRLLAVVGANRTRQILNSSSTSHLIIAGE